ncbi:MAG: Mu transposase domain-containing protein, partial [Chloroflexota bacterium]
RIHGTTKERPLEAFRAREQAALLPLPPRPWEPATWDSLLVNRDCHIRLAGEDYTVPACYVGRRLDVRSTRTMVDIYDGATLVMPYVRQPGGQTHIEHYPEAAQAFLKATPQVCRQRATAVGSATAMAVGLLLEPGTLTQLRQAQAILRLADRFGPERLERACRKALYAGDARYRTVRGILEGGFDQLDVEEPPPPTWVRGFLRGPAATLASLEDQPAAREVG